MSTIKWYKKIFWLKFVPEKSNETNYAMFMGSCHNSCLLLCLFVSGHAIVNIEKREIICIQSFATSTVWRRWWRHQLDLVYLFLFFYSSLVIHSCVKQLWDWDISPLPCSVIIEFFRFLCIISESGSLYFANDCVSFVQYFAFLV